MVLQEQQPLLLSCANLTSYSEANYSSTHKAAGAVATVYGNATINNVEVKDVQFNKEHAAGKYRPRVNGGFRLFV